MDIRLERILTSSANKKTEDPQPFLQQGQRQHDFQVKTQKLLAIQTARQSVGHINDFNKASHFYQSCRRNAHTARNSTRRMEDNSII